MHRFERISIAIRHAPLLDGADWLWDRVRPSYDRVLHACFSERGISRVINGTDRIVLSPLARGFASETYEPEVWRRIMREVRPADVIAEAGASIGIYTLAFAARAGGAGHVFAFEPDRQSADTLEANVAVNRWQDRVSIIRAALGESCGTVAFGAGRGMESRVAAADDGAAKSIRIPMVTLDRALAGQRVSILKIDVEGYEEPVLRGGAALLRDRSRRPRTILVETHPFAWEAVGTSSESLLGLLRECGYRIEDLSGAPMRRIEHYGHLIALAE
ncbi:MAG TPA: FkbM family methyltransferase [Candidatus Binataceae bacterium]|nr:FkbM family methyltransferase [Candidatus Binataceae bacterium]